MYTIRRVTKVPATALQIQIDQPNGDGDGGFQAGGVYLFQPAGQDGDTHQVSEHAAAVLMGDPSLADHFECDPALPKKAVKAVAAEQAAANESEAAAEAAAVSGEPDHATDTPKRKGRGGKHK